MSVSVSDLHGVSNDINLGPTGSLQFQFAKLQLAMAEISKNSALDYMQQIRDSQEEQKEIAAMLQTARQAQADAKTSGSADLPSEIVAYMEANKLAMPAGSNVAKMQQAEEVFARCKQLQQDAIDGRGNCPWDVYASMMTKEDAKFFSDNGIAYDTCGNDLAHNPTEWAYNIKQLEAFKTNLKPYTTEDMDTVIQSLQTQMDKVGSNTQQLMVFVQDYMGQYNSYLQGSNSVIQQANQTLGELARAR